MDFSESGPVDIFMLRFRATGDRCRRPVRTTAGLVSTFRFASLGLIIIGTQLNGDPAYLEPAITFSLVELILPLALAAEIGRRATAAYRAR